MDVKKKHIVSIVFNSVEGDSRVIKTAQAALNAGYHSTIIGVTSSKELERKEIEGVQVVLLPNYASPLKKQGLWEDSNKDLRLLIGGYLLYAIPEIISLKPDLLHSHDMIGLKIGGAVHKTLLAGGRSIPLVHDLHEFVAGLKGDLAERYMLICLGWEREFLHVADHLVTVSDALAAEIKERYSLPYLPTVIYNTPKADSASSGADIRSKIGLAADVPLIVFVGGASRLRGCETILEAVVCLDGVHLVLISEGKYVSELTEKAIELGIGERFHVHPYVPSDQVTSFIRTADIGIHGLIHYPNAEVAMPNE
jgi:glycosyltransferase involved in cell wall biosynthesis